MAKSMDVSWNDLYRTSPEYLPELDEYMDVVGQEDFIKSPSFRLKLLSKISLPMV